MLNSMAFVSTILFMMSGIPVAIQSIRAHKGSAPLKTCMCTVAATALMWSYLTIKNGFDLMVTISYASSFFCFLISMIYDVRDVYNKDV